MGKLSLAARNMTVQLPEVQAYVASGLLGSDETWADGWVFDSHIPNRFLDNKSQQAVIVFSQANWQDMNLHNFARFPLLNMDIWAAPEKDEDNSIVEWNAEDIIEDVFDSILPYFHLTNSDVPGKTGDSAVSYMGNPGMIRYWGTAAQIADGSGYPILSSSCINIGDFQDVAEGNGAKFRRHSFGIQTV